MNFTAFLKRKPTKEIHLPEVPSPSFIMNFLQSKRDLEKYLSQDLDLLSQHYGIRAENENDRLWLLAIAILSNKKYAQMIGPPTYFDDYFTEIRVLGKGSFGFVILAELKRDYKELLQGNRVAIKLIRAGLSSKALKDAQHEVAILRDISSIKRECNPHIVCYYDSFEMLYARTGPPRRYFAILMEYVPGQTLEEVIGRKPSDPQVLQFMKTLASTLEFLHNHQIVHRDIKAGNIMLDVDANNILKYIDFGFSCSTIAQRNYSCKKDASGTPYYMAPEIWKIWLKPREYIPVVDLYNLYKKADVWALGILFYELLFGDFPPEIANATTKMEVARAVESKTMSFPTDSQRDPRLIEVIKGMLVTNPDERNDITQIVNELNKLKLVYL